MVPGFPWFGPKTSLGWGWTPVAWQGWAVTIGFVAVICTIAYGPPFRFRLAAVLGLAALFVVVAAATGSKPGGSWR